MSNNLDDLKFILTGEMAYILHKIINIKNEIYMIENQMKHYKNTVHYHSLSNSKNILEQRLEKLKKDFIEAFKKENKKQIEKYWNNDE